MHNLNAETGFIYDDFQDGTVFKIDDQLLMYKGDLGENFLNITDVRSGKMHYVIDPQTGLRTAPTKAWLLLSIAEGAVEIVTSPQAKKSASAIPIYDIDHDEIRTLDKKAEARVGLLFQLATEGVQSHDPRLAEHIRRIWKADYTEFDDRPEVSTVRTWLRRTDPERPRIEELISMTGRVPRAKRLDPEASRIVNEFANWYWFERGRKLTDVMAEAHVAVVKLNVERKAGGIAPIKLPSRETFRREIRRIESRDLWALKFGEVAAKRHWAASMSAITASRALELVMIDDTVLDCVACVDAERRLPANRPFICVAIDVATRCIVGWVLSFTPPSTHTAAECVRRIGTDKFNLDPKWTQRYPVLRQIAGKPNAIYSDNGSNYVSAAFVDILRDLGIMIRRAPIASPKSKAIIERFFFTLKTWLLEKLPGATLEPKIMRELAYNPEVKAVLLIEELESLIQEFINVYHISVHSGINTQPAAAWHRSISAHGRQLLDTRKLAVLSWITVPNRRLTTGGVRFKGLVYRDARTVNELLDANVPFEPMKPRIKGSAACFVQIKYNPDNVGSILVRNRATSNYAEIPCVQKEYAEGLTLHQHGQIGAWAKARNLEFNTEAERLAALHGLNTFIEATIQTCQPASAVHSPV